MPVRPPTVSKPLAIHRLDLDKAALDAIPEDARRLFFLFGHIANEVNTLSRLTLFSLKEHEDQVRALYGESHLAVCLRLLIGKTHEGYRAVSDRVLGSRFNITYIPHMGREGQKALKTVKKEMSEWKLLAAVRNSYSFHNPTDEQIDAAYVALPADIGLSIFMGQPRHSYLFVMSNLLIVRGMLDAAGKTDDTEGMSRIVDDVLDKSAHLFDFIEHLLFTIVEREKLSSRPMEKDVLIVDAVASHGTFKIPAVCRS
jgi:hypothetical protein